MRRRWRLKHLLEGERTEEILDEGFLVAAWGFGQERGLRHLLADDEGADGIAGLGRVGRRAKIIVAHQDGAQRLSEGEVGARVRRVDRLFFILPIDPFVDVCELIGEPCRLRLSACHGPKGESTTKGQGRTAEEGASRRREEEQVLRPPPLNPPRSVT